MKTIGYEERHVYSQHFPFRVQCSNHPLRMPPHWHSAIELMYFYATEGCEYRCRDSVIPVRGRELIVANSTEVHECRDFGRSSVCCITIAPEMLGEYQGVLFCRHIAGDERLDGLFDRIRQALQAPAFAEFLCAGLINELLFVLLSTYVADNLSDRQRIGYNASVRVIDTVLQYVAGHPAEELSIGRLAAIAGLSDSRFCHVFRRVTGISPTAYVEQVRIDHARCLLADREMSLAQIAQECGFADQSYFTRRFKRCTGLTPGQFRAHA